MWAARALKRTDVQLTIVSEKPNFQNKCESLLVAARTGSNEKELSHRSGSEAVQQVKLH